MRFSFSTNSHEESINAGRFLGEELEAACVIGLVGDLGAGKTCFVKGIAGGLNNIPEREVTSPTFTILQEYDGRIPLYHFDAYRLGGTNDLVDIGFDDYVEGPGVSVIEWADNITDAIPEERLLIDIELVGENSRRFNCCAEGVKHEAVLEKFRKKLEE